MPKAQPVVRSAKDAIGGALRCLILTIAMQKGGVGKTTWARVFAEYCALVRKARVLVIDLDPQCNLSQRFLAMERDPLAEDGVLPPIHPEYDPETEKDWDGRSSITNVFYGRPLIPYSTYVPNIDILPGHGSLLQKVIKASETELKERVTNRLREFLRSDEVQDSYDIIVVDTPPSKNALTEAALRASTHVMMPMEPEPQAQEGLVYMLAFWRSEQRQRTTEDPLVHVGVLPNKFRKGVVLHEGILGEMRRNKTVAPYIMPFEVSLRIAYSEADHAEAKPKSVLERGRVDETRREAELVCRHIEGRVFGNVTE